jgi:heat shock protein HslJ
MDRHQELELLRRSTVMIRRTDDKYGRIAVRRPRLTLLLFALAVTGLASCSDGDDRTAVTPPTTVVTADDLEGQSFGSTAVTGHDLVPDTTVSLTFAEHLVSAVAGCNTQNAGVDVVGGRLQITSEFAATSLRCEDRLLDQDRWVAEFLGSGPMVALDGPILTLNAGDEAIQLESKL